MPRTVKPRRKDPRMAISVLLATYSLKSTGLTSALGTNDACMSDFFHIKCLINSDGAHRKRRCRCRCRWDPPVAIVPLCSASTCRRRTLSDDVLADRNRSTRSVSSPLVDRRCSGPAQQDQRHAATCAASGPVVGRVPASLTAFSCGLDPVVVTRRLPCDR